MWIEGRTERSNSEQTSWRARCPEAIPNTPNPTFHHVERVSLEDIRRCPRAQRDLPSGTQSTQMGGDESVHCRFHRTVSHNTNDFFNVKKQIEELVQQGQLKKYITWEEKNKQMANSRIKQLAWLLKPRVNCLYYYYYYF